MLTANQKRGYNPDGSTKCPPGSHAMPDGTCMSDTEMSAAFADEGHEPPDVANEPWHGVLTVEGVESGDGRVFALGGLDWAQMPLPLMYQPANVGGHNASVMIGQITQAARKGSEIFGWGEVFADSLAGEHGPGIRAMIETGGVSVDVDKVKDADVEYVYGDPDEDVNADSTFMMTKPQTTIYHRGRIRGATLVAFPAFVEAKLAFTNAQAEPVTASASCGCGVEEIITAAGHVITLPDVPPAHWFDKPTDVRPYGALTVTDEGRVYGWLAPSDTTHRAVRKTVPMGARVDYSRWQNKETIVAGGGRVVTGVITMNCGHAPTEDYGSFAKRREHYDNSCSIFANAVMGEDADGVWVAGALRHGVSADQVSAAMGCQLSGDWQPHPDRPGKLEFIAALLVPVPGFPMARTRPSVQYADGALVASSVPVRFTNGVEPATHEFLIGQAMDAIQAAKRITMTSLGLDPASRKAAVMVEFHGNHNEKSHGNWARKGGVKTPSKPKIKSTPGTRGKVAGDVDESKTEDFDEATRWVDRMRERGPSATQLRNNLNKMSDDEIDMVLSVLRGTAGSREQAIQKIMSKFQ